MPTGYRRFALGSLAIVLGACDIVYEATSFLIIIALSLLPGIGPLATLYLLVMEWVDKRAAINNGQRLRVALAWDLCKGGCELITADFLQPEAVLVVQLEQFGSRVLEDIHKHGSLTLYYLAQPIPIAIIIIMFMPAALRRIVTVLSDTLVVLIPVLVWTRTLLQLAGNL